MADTFRAAVAFDNLADRPTTLVRASSAAPYLPAQLLRNVHVGRKWRALTTAATLFCDFGSSVSLDTIALVGCNVGPGGSCRVRGSNTDSEALTGTVLDVGSVGGDLRYGYQLTLLPAPVSVRYLRIDLTEPSAAVEAGRLFAGLRHQFRINFAYGWSMTRVDPSIKSKSAGGSTHIDRKRHYRLLDLTFEHLTPEERWGFIEDLDVRVGGSNDVLLISHPDEPDFGQRAIWGLVNEPAGNVESFFQNFARQYQIEERL